MIQKKGKIGVKTNKARNAVFESLVKSGISGQHEDRRHDAPCQISWSAGHSCTRGVEWDSKDRPEHTLSDFDLLPGGEPMLTMEDIEVGGSYEVRSDLNDGEEYGGLTFDSDMDHLLGEEVTINWIGGTLFSLRELSGGYRWTPQMLQRRVDKPEQKPFKDGDRVVFSKIVIDAFKAERLSRVVIAKSAPLNDLTIKEHDGHWLITGEGVDYLVQQDGTGSLGDNPRVQVILHAPTFGHLKAGDPNPFLEISMEVSTPYGVAEVNDFAPGPLVKIITRAGTCLTCGYDEYGNQVGPFSINDILPENSTQEQPAPHEYQFGDKVKVEGVVYKQVIVSVLPNGKCLVCMEEEFEKTELSKVILRLKLFNLSDISPWPEPVTLWFCTSEDREEEDRVTISKDGVSLGRKGYSLEDAIAIGEEAAKIRGNE